MGQEQLDKYELLERLGQGGMGEVWKARDTQLRRYVAIKLLHADLQADPDFVAHFMREARLVASLRHSNIVQLHDFQLTNTQGADVKAYMVMDYLEGGTLADYIRNTVRKGLFLSAADLVSLFAAIGLALDYAHQKGMVHRDIKPANILLDRPTTTTMGRAIGEPVLTDFGIARLQGAGTSTVTRAFVGTPLYISPEQAEGRPVDERSDLYSLGIVLYEILTGVTPFRGDSPLAIMMHHVHEKPPPPALINPNISPMLSAVVLRSIAKNSEERFPSATAMTVALAQALNQPIPENVRKPGEKDAYPAYNPLQPLPGKASYAPLSPFLHTPPAVSLPTSTSYSASQANTPTQLPSAVSAPGEKILSAAFRENGSAVDTPSRGSGRPQRGSLVVPLPVRARRKWLFVALIACVLLLLVGIGAFSVPSLFFQNHATSTPTPSAAGDVVGHIVFISSPTAPHVLFNQLQVDVDHILPPPSGTTYYGWLEQKNSEAEIPHWHLQVSNASVHGLYSGNQQQTDLFTTSSLFLITEEAINNVPVIPIPDPGRHRYYALITPTSSASPSFEVRQCPASSQSNPSNPCR